MKLLSPSDKTLNFLCIIIIVMVAFVMVICLFFLQALPIIMWIIIGVFFLISIILTGFYLPTYFAQATYVLSDEVISKQSGLIWNRNHIMRIDAIQHISVISTPFSSLTHLNFIVFYALGARLIFPFLEKNAALKIQEEITTKISGGGK